MTDEELLSLNQAGFIPGPQESEADFLERVSAGKEFYLSRSEEWIPPAHWDWVRLHLKALFDFEPVFLPAFYSNQGLSIWEGAAAWIEGGALQSIQLRTGLKTGSYLGLYRREEILAHEAVHGARSAFEEPKSEEFFAYMTSEKRWRKIVGPILRRPWEIWPFFLSLVGGIVGQFAALYSEWGEPLSIFCFWSAAIWAGGGIFRLWSQRRKLNRAGKNVLNAVGDLKKMRAVLFRLTDEEIDRFAQGAKVREYAERQSCLRWRLIRLVYF